MSTTDTAATAGCGLATDDSPFTRKACEERAWAKRLRGSASGHRRGAGWMSQAFSHQFVPDDEGLFCLFCGRTAGEHGAAGGAGAGKGDRAFALAKAAPEDIVRARDRHFVP